ncbi:MAG: PocR ligand-binding domain-containing protein [Armatimonadetes bacterium]|nr:PocR ligand-binding domain-containing protein [Akkermansiaceae bacterium]
MEANLIARKALTTSGRAAGGLKAEISRTAGRPFNGKVSEKLLIALLLKSNVYREYEHAFVAATGLPLSLHAPDMITIIRHSRRQENPFCALMVNTSEWCTASYVLQRKVESAAQHAPKTLKCFAGLCETTVPVRVGGNVIAFLQTGQILLHQPDRAHFDKILRKLKLWNSEVDLKKVEEAWFNSRVLTSKQYEALVSLLDIFAHQLATCSNALILDSAPQQRPDITKARTFITDHCGDDMSLAAVSRIANMSANYFSGKFVEATGMNFVEYVTRTRVEKACTLLQNPNLRISEIAFDVGFQSLSQFNRGFKQVSGQCPREYRDGLTNA